MCSTTLTGTTSSGQSGPGNDVNEGVHTPQVPKLEPQQ